LCHLPSLNNLEKGEVPTKIKICSVANTKYFLAVDVHFDDPITAEEAKQHISEDSPHENAHKMDLDEYLEDMIEFHTKPELFNVDPDKDETILIDCSSSPEIPKHFKKLLEKGIKIVTPNKKAVSDDFSQFQDLLPYFINPQNKTSFLFETTVCAGLPIVNLVKNFRSENFEN